MKNSFKHEPVLRKSLLVALIAIIAIGVLFIAPVHEEVRVLLYNAVFLTLLVSGLLYTVVSAMKAAWLYKKIKEERKMIKGRKHGSENN